MVGTIYRGIQNQARKSVKILLEHILENISTQDYYKLLMLDLPEILEEKVIDVTKFFENEVKEVHEDEDDVAVEDRKEDSGELTIEIKLKENLDPFSPEP